MLVCRNTTYYKRDIDILDFLRCYQNVKKKIALFSGHLVIGDIYNILSIYDGIPEKIKQNMKLTMEIPR